MTRKLVYSLGMLSLGAVAGCEVLQEVLERLGSIELLGIVPEQGFSDPGSPDHGRVKLAIGGRDDAGVPGPIKDAIEVVPDDGTEVEEEEPVEVPGHDVGSFLVLVDGSGSVEYGYCYGCPTDPGRLRVEAVKALAEDLAKCGEWRMGLLEFGAGTPSAGMNVSSELVAWTTDPEAMASGADALGSYYGTPLWDATFDALKHLAADAGSFEEEAGATLVVMSDGADTESARSVDDVIAKALEVGLQVNTVGFGPASDSVDAPENAAVDGLRRLALETGGYYGYVSSPDDLPVLTKAIAGAACGGYTELYAKFEEPPASGSKVTGKVRLKRAKDLAVPFTFTAP